MTLTQITRTGSSSDGNPRSRGAGYRERVPLAAAVVLLLAIISSGLIVLSATIGIRFNLTKSLPGIIYLTTSDQSSPLIEFCPEGDFAHLSKERGYRAPGICPDGAAPMLKTIVAQPGDRVEVSANGITINGTLLSNSAPRFTDSRGRHLSHYPFGKYTVSAGSVWVASQYNPLSFDSRYYGPISVACIRHHLRPL